MTESEQERKIFLDYARSFAGRWYVWGGDDPAGFDCSGFVIECLKAVGKLPRQGDWTAHQLAHKFIVTANPVPADLVFWHAKKDKKKIIHVEIMVSHTLALGASGGGSKTLTVADAMRHNAFIKMRPVNSRANIWGYCDPFWHQE